LTNPYSGAGPLRRAWEKTDLPRNHPPHDYVTHIETGELVLIWPCGQHYAVGSNQRPRRRFHCLRAALELQYARWFGRVPGTSARLQLPTTCTACQVLGADDLFTWTRLFNLMPEEHLVPIALQYAAQIDDDFRRTLEEGGTRFIPLPRRGPLAIASLTRNARYAGMHDGTFYLIHFDPTPYGPELMERMLADLETGAFN